MCYYFFYQTCYLKIIRILTILIEHNQKKRYKHKFNPNNSLQILNNIETPLLKSYCDHIHY
ncbi:complement regulator-acquiring protein (plasmid) [Borreliella yangtzensis]|uniref:complement regulator-acquiring protein n=1 Tax=Borreliella yangtzensis TaxID=683292 RepID=UPI001605E820